MIRWSFGIVGTLCAGLACATVESESAASAASAPVARPGMYAASSAPFVKRLTAEQRDEWRFLKDAAAVARFELDASKLALSRSSDPRVRSLATSLVKHHGSTRPRLARMLGARGMAPPMQSNEQRKALNRLARLHGDRFDREWMQTVGLRSQQEGVFVYERAAQTARDPELRSWVEQQLPAMRWQLQAAEQRGLARPTAYKVAPPMAEPPAAPATVLNTR